MGAILSRPRNGENPPKKIRTRSFSGGSIGKRSSLFRSFSKRKDGSTAAKSATLQPTRTATDTRASSDVMTEPIMPSAQSALKSSPVAVNSKPDHVDEHVIQESAALADEAIDKATESIRREETTVVSLSSPSQLVVVNPHKHAGKHSPHKVHKHEDVKVETQPLASGEQAVVEVAPEGPSHEEHETLAKEFTDDVIQASIEKVQETCAEPEFEKSAVEEVNNESAEPEAKGSTGVVPIQPLVAVTGPAEEKMAVEVSDGDQEHEETKPEENLVLEAHPAEVEVTEEKSQEPEVKPTTELEVEMSSQPEVEVDLKDQEQELEQPIEQAIEEAPVEEESSPKASDEKHESEEVAPLCEVEQAPVEEGEQQPKEELEPVEAPMEAEECEQEAEPELPEPEVDDETSHPEMDVKAPEDDQLPEAPADSEPKLPDEEQPGGEATAHMVEILTTEAEDVKPPSDQPSDYVEVVQPAGEEAPAQVDSVEESKDGTVGEQGESLVEPSESNEASDEAQEVQVVGLSDDAKGQSERPPVDLAQDVPRMEAVQHEADVNSELAVNEEVTKSEYGALHEEIVGDTGSTAVEQQPQDDANDAAGHQPVHGDACDTGPLDGGNVDHDASLKASGQLSENGETADTVE
ncbi:unnamed protein product [Mesocestoides corti]|uniref:CaM_binding domain-containing protein n=1 Tax=Mesocestoides corti TaxID=53468 RepID=A0A0R3UA03_MESCO|nr:unnamed protein product [Mesocestoides corti]